MATATTDYEEYVVKDGDTFGGIAKKYGVRDLKELWKANPELRKDCEKRDRKEPEKQIRKKDVVKIPGELSPKVGVTLLVAGKTYKFRDVKEREEFRKTVKAIEFNGKLRTFVGSEWDDEVKVMQKELRRTAVVAANTRAQQAADLWDIFNKLNDEQWVVSWFVSLSAPKLPPHTLIQGALNRASRLETAVASGDFASIQAALEKAEKEVNAASDTMWEYQRQVVGTSGKWVKGLEFTKTTSFALVGAMAAPAVGPVLGSTALGGAIAAGGTALVKTTFEELAEGTYGEKEKGAQKRIVKILLKTAQGATVGALLKSERGTELIKNAGEYMVSMGSTIPHVSQSSLAPYLTAYLKNAGESLMISAVEEAGKLATAETKAPEFFKNVAQSTALGGFMRGLGQKVSDEYAPTVLDKITQKWGPEFFAHCDAKPLKLVQDVMKTTPKHAGKALTTAFQLAKGAEPDNVIDDAAGRLAKDPEFLDKLKAMANAKSP
jgi:hypothetical protein